MLARSPAGTVRLLRNHTGTVIGDPTADGVLTRLPGSRRSACGADSDRIGGLTYRGVVMVYFVKAFVAK